MNIKKILIWIGIIILVIILLGIIKNIRDNTPPSTTPNVGLTGCGNGVCEDDETDRNCKLDCCSKVFQKESDENCIKKGWNKEFVNVNGRPRKLFWKAPEGEWNNGAIITLHGGGGYAATYCGESPLSSRLFGQNMNKADVEFTESAISEGFAVFSLDSGYNLATDLEGRGMGKRWDWFAQKSRENIDIPFIEKVIDNTIPSKRPAGSSESVFIEGHSSGSFTALLVSTHLNDKVDAFVLVAGGDPYGMYGDMGYIHPTKPMRKCVPGTVRDNENQDLIDVPNICLSDSYPNELKWPETKRSIPFKQFIHEDDGLVDMSCMRKAQEQLIGHGYQDDGPFIVTRSTDPVNPNLKISQGLDDHLWQEQYTQPMLDFFKKYSVK
jgi:hypothetical protein